MLLSLLRTLAWLAVGVSLGAAPVPPPPEVNPAEIPGQASAPAFSPEASPQSDQQEPPSSDNASLPPAPQISEEQMIANSMDVAYQLYHAEDYEGTAQAAQQILDKYPKRNLYYVRYLLALCKEHTGYYREAIRNYQKVMKQEPNSSYSNAAAFRVGVCYGALDDVPDAVNAFRDIIDFNPKSEYRLQAYIFLGNLYKRQNQWEPAEHIYQDMMRLYPCSTWSSTAQQYLAEAYAHQGKSDLAMEIYRRMQFDNCVPRFMAAQAQLRIGDMLMGQQRYQDAMFAYHAAIQEYSGQPGVKLYAQQQMEAARRGRNQDPDQQIEDQDYDVYSPSGQP